MHINVPEDLLAIHETAQRAAAKAGAPPLDQLRFAMTVVNSYEAASPAPKTIFFSITLPQENRPLLVATTETDASLGLLWVPFEKFDQAVARRSRQEIELQNRDLEQVTLAICHDLKNSTTKLKLGLSLIAEESIPEVNKPVFDIINRAALHLESTLKSMTKVIELGHLSEDIVERLSIPTIFRQVCEEFNDIRKDPAPAINTDFADGDEFPYIGIYIRSIFSNLLSNSIKYADSKRPLKISTGTRKSSDGLELYFEDNGSGIDLKQYGHKIFLPFTRFSTVMEGSGIGLYMIRSMVERNKGSIHIESEPGKGTAFRFLLKPYATMR